MRSAFISCIYRKCIMYMYYLLTLSNSPDDEIHMNSSIYTTFDQKSTVNKRIERWYERTLDRSGKCKGVYLHVSRTELSSLVKFTIRLFFLTLLHGIDLHTRKSLPNIQYHTFYHRCYFFTCLWVPLNAITSPIHGHGLFTCKNEDSWSVFWGRFA